MRVLLLGLSSIGIRRVLPAFGTLEDVSAIDLASRGKSAPASWPKPGEFYADYDRAIAESDADLVYISLPNAMHENWVCRALAAGKHVVVDKPAFLSLDAASSCLATATARGLVLAEATVFEHHPHIDTMQAFLAETGPVTHVDAHFIIPPLASDNFRNHAALGGGCLADMGPYAASLARLFGGDLDALEAFAATDNLGLDVDVGFSILARFSNGVRYTGHFSFEGEYQNRLTVVARHGSIVVDRIFSPPNDAAITWATRRNNQPEAVVHAAADSFGLFLRKVLQAIASKDTTTFASSLLEDAQFRSRLDDQLRKAPH